MIGLDTNILVRYIIQDDPVQAAKASAFLETLTADVPGFLTLISVAELCWVLTRRYKWTRKQFAQALERLLISEEIQIESAPLVREALRLFEQSNTDFDDCLIFECAVAAGCDSIVTFDRNAARTLGMQLLD